MNVVMLQSGHLSRLYEIYQQATATAAHCRFNPSRDHFAHELTHPAQEGTRILVAEADGVVQGFAALLEAQAAEDGVPEALIAGLFALEEQPCQLLLDACVAHAGDAARIVAFPATHRRCPIRSYNGGWDGLSDHMPLVARLLSRNGFTPFYRELHLEYASPPFPPAPAAAAAGIAIVEQATDYGGWELRAMDGDQEAGGCGLSTLALRSDHPEARQWGYIDWLYVAEPWRRRGLARHLMTRALGRLHKQGCHSCWLTTGADNWRAQPLYFALGFQIVDASACYRKILATD